MEEHGIALPALQSPHAVVFCAEERAFVGYAELEDKLRPDAKEALVGLKGAGIQKIAVLSGGHRGTGKGSPSGASRGRAPRGAPARRKAARRAGRSRARVRSSMWATASTIRPSWRRAMSRWRWAGSRKRRRHRSERSGACLRFPQGPSQGHADGEKDAEHRP